MNFDIHTTGTRRSVCLQPPRSERRRTERDDPAIAHFTQTDTIVPGAGNPLAWNRYAYTLYNPLRYVDPSGHWTSKKQFVEIMLEELHVEGSLIDNSEDTTISFTIIIEDKNKITYHEFNIEYTGWDYYEMSLDFVGLMIDTATIIAILDDSIGFAPDDPVVIALEFAVTTLELESGIEKLIESGDYNDLWQEIYENTSDLIVENTKIIRGVPVIGAVGSLLDFLEEFSRGIDVNHSVTIIWKERE